MIDIDWVLKVVVIVMVISVLAYIIPGMALRAVKDFKRKYGKGKGEADVKKSKT